MKGHPQQEMRLEEKVNILCGESIIILIHIHTQGGEHLARIHTREAHYHNKRGAAFVKGVRESY